MRLGKSAQAPTSSPTIDSLYVRSSTSSIARISPFARQFQTRQWRPLNAGDRSQKTHSRPCSASSKHAPTRTRRAPASRPRTTSARSRGTQQVASLRQVQLIRHCASGIQRGPMSRTRRSCARLCRRAPSRATWCSSAWPSIRSMRTSWRAAARMAWCGSGMCGARRLWAR